MNYFLKKRVLAILSLILIVSLGVPAFAQKKGKKANEATRRSQDAATAFNEIMGAPDNAIPKELVDKAQAIAVFPSVSGDTSFSSVRMTASFGKVTFPADAAVCWGAAAKPSSPRTAETTPNPAPAPKRASTSRRLNLTMSQLPGDLVNW